MATPHTTMTGSTEQWDDHVCYMASVKGAVSAALTMTYQEIWPALGAGISP